MHVIDWKTPPAGFNPQELAAPPLPVKVRKIRHLALDISGDCNIACRYCQERATKPTREPMRLETLERIWRFLFPEGPIDKEDYSIHLGSGEPLLNFPVVQRLQQLVEETQKEKGVHIQVNLTTNGTLVDDAMLDWLGNSGWIIKVSIDGPAEIQDKWRPMPGGNPTYPQVEKVVKGLVERCPNHLQASAVYSPGTDPAVVFETFENLGIRRIEMVPVVSKKESLRLNPEDIQRFRAFIMNYAKRFLAEDLSKPPAIFGRLSQYMRRLMGYQLAGIRCAAGRMYFGVGPKGDLFPCSHFVEVDGYRCGHVDTGLDTQAVEAFQQQGGREYRFREPCNQCWGAPLCTGPCFAFSELFGTGKQPLDYQCDFALATAEAAIYLFNELSEKSPERLLLFLAVNDDIF